MGLLETILSSAAGKAAIEALSKWNKQGEVRALVEEHKRRISATRISNNHFAELTRIRETFLKYGLAEKSASNEQFFKTWLTHVAVEMGWTPGGYWNREKIEALHADVERIHA